MLQHDIIRKPILANLVAIAMPWLLVIPFSTGSGFDIVIDFGGSIFIGITCFVAPPVLFICALRPKWLYKSVDVPTRDLEKVEEVVQVAQDNDTQFPVISNVKQVNYMSVGSFVILGALLASLSYSWYTSIA